MRCLLTDSVRGHTALIAGVMAMAGVARADISPPVAIKLVQSAPIAYPGREYAGTFEIHVFTPGDLSEIRIEGKGWAVRQADLPTSAVEAAAGTIRIPFRAVPANADEPVGLSLRHQGRLVRTLFDVGPAHAAWKERAQVLTRAPGTSGLRPGVEREEATTTEGTTAAGGAVPIRVVGRIVYDRPGVDRSDPEDGDFDDPEDTRPVVVGADTMRVRLQDADFVGRENIWVGTTDEQGYFDSGVIMWDDCEVIPLPPFYDCDVPDLVLRIVALSPDKVTVVNTNLDIYLSEFPEIENFAGDFYDYGWLSTDANDMPAIHMVNSVVRAARFVAAGGASQSNHVAVIWPDDSKGDAAWFTPGEDAIHISTDRQWRTDTIIHEFGHHQMNLFYAPIPAPDYCDVEMDCDPNPPATCGHCIWCDENANVAWFEGWPNWLADVVTRDYPNRYIFDDGTPYRALYTRSQEHPGTCDGSFGDPLTTEGFVGALLRDIEDSTQDDHDDDPSPLGISRDGVFDLLCLGVDEIFHVMETGKPLTVTEFISDFLAEYPQHTGNLWSTAVNVGGGAYVTSFPPDIDPPAAVTTCDSPTHPIGTGGGATCVTLEWDPASDDATGANAYSYFLHQNPAGVEPDEEADPVYLTDHCKLSADTVAWELGDWYFSIKARDNWGKWSNTWSTFGPFEITDCNGTGLLDMCDIDCEHTGRPGGGICEFVLSPCVGLEGCGLSEDCNENLKPDECDIVEGESEDCDINGVPDECQNMKHWASELDPPEGYDWGLDGNWAEGEHPVPLDVACIPADSYGATVVFTEADAPLTSLACYLNFIIDGPSTIWPESLELMENSFVLGSMEIAGNSKVTVNDRLYVNETLHWKGGQIDGQGVTEVNDGLRLTQSSVDLLRGDFKLRGGAGISTGPLINMYYGATFLIDTSATYSYEGNSYLFYGGVGRIDVRGELNRTAGDANATVFTPLDNSGTVRTMTGELTIGLAGTHTGAFIADPGAALTFSVYSGSATHEFLPASSVTTDTLTLGNGTGNFHGTVDITNWLYGRGGTWTFFDDANIISYGQHVNVDRGRVIFEGPTDRPTPFESVTITSPGESAGAIDFNSGQPVEVGSLSLLKGGLYGSSPINVSDTFTWTNGSFWAGGAITANGPVVINATSSNRTLSRVLNINDQAIFRSGFSLYGAGRVNIADGAIVNMQFNGGGVSGGVFANHGGTVLRTSGDGEIGIGSAIINNGLFHNQTGTFSFATHPLNGTSTYTGDIISDPGTILKFAGSGHELQSSSTMTAESLVLWASSSTVHGSVNISDRIECTGCGWTFASDADIISYGQDLSIAGGTLTFEAPTDSPIDFDSIAIGPTTSGGSTVDFNTGQTVRTNTLIISRGSTLRGNCPIEIADQFTWVNGNIFPGGAIRCDGASTIQPTSSSRTLSRPLDNYGVMTVRGGFSIGSGGVLNNKPGAVMDLQYENASLGISGTINNEGTMIKSTTAGTAGLPNVVNTGTIDVQLGAISFHASYVGLTQTAGETILNETTVEMFYGPKAFELQGGLLRGNGSVVGELDNSGGTVTPGFSVGEIEVDDYTQGAKGVLEMEIGGSNAGEYDVLTVTNTATLAGEIRVTDIDLFLPQGGDTFVILTAASVDGTFDTEAVPSHYEVVYGATDVTLRFNGPSPDLNGDGLVDLRDYAVFLSCFSGAGHAPAASCRAGVNADLDGDGDVDLDDYERWFVAITR